MQWHIKLVSMPGATDLCIKDGNFFAHLQPVLRFCPRPASLWCSWNCTKERERSQDFSILLKWNCTTRLRRWESSWGLCYTLQKWWPQCHHPKMLYREMPAGQGRHWGVSLALQNTGNLESSLCPLEKEDLTPLVPVFTLAANKATCWKVISYLEQCNNKGHRTKTCSSSENWGFEVL